MFKRPIVFIFPLLLCFAGLSATQAHAAKDLANYPLRIRVYTTNWRGSDSAGYSGDGRANLIEGAETHGFDYVYSCDSRFKGSDGDEAYFAKWKKPGKSIEMLMGVIGNPDKLKSCELKVSLHEFIFSRNNGVLTTITQDDYKTREAQRAARRVAMAPEDKDPTHYPLRLAILNLNWSETVGGMHIGSGQANLTTASSISSVDFTARCPLVIPPNPEGRFYRSRWKHEDTDLILLMHKNIDPNSAATCELKVRLNPDVYVLQSTGVVKAVTQVEYMRMHAKDTMKADEAP